MRTPSVSGACSAALFYLALTALSCDRPLPTGDVEGITCFAGTAIPVSAVLVDIGGKTATSASSGTYRIEGIPAGDLTVKAEKIGFDTYSSGVAISAGSQILDIHMTSAQFTGKVHGTVTGEYSGYPKPGFHIILLNPDGSESDLKTTSDSVGYYLLLPVPHGERKLMIKATTEELIKVDITPAGPDYPFDFAVPEPFEMFTDSRDGKSYASIRIGTQTWMAENLAYLPAVFPPSEGGYAENFYYVQDYQGHTVAEAALLDNYRSYGVLYNEKAAQTACPPGWHLPSDGQWMELETYLGMESTAAEETGDRVSGELGRKLKSTAGWTDGRQGDGSLLFNANPGGNRNRNGGFGSLGLSAGFWTGTASGSSVTFSRVLNHDSDGISRSSSARNIGLSIRCVKY